MPGGATAQNVQRGRYMREFGGAAGKGCGNRCDPYPARLSELLWLANFGKEGKLEAVIPKMSQDSS